MRLILFNFDPEILRFDLPSEPAESLPLVFLSSLVTTGIDQIHIE